MLDALDPETEEPDSALLACMNKHMLRCHTREQQAITLHVCLILQGNTPLHLPLSHDDSASCVCVCDEHLSKVEHKAHT